MFTAIGITQVMTKYTSFKICKLGLGKAHFEELLSIRDSAPITAASLTLQMEKALDRVPQTPALVPYSGHPQTG